MTLTFSVSPKTMLTSFMVHRNIIQQLIKRDIVNRYQGSFLGIIWSLVYPLLMISVYTFVFGVAFKAKWGVGAESKAEFALVLFIGMLVFLFFSECVNRSTTLILNNVNYVKKIVFPLEILPWSLFGASLFHLLINIVVWFVFYVYLHGLPPLTCLYFPLILLPLCFLVMGFSWFLACLGVFLRDMSQIINVITSITMFLTPIFYPMSSLPENYQHILYFNPLTVVIEELRNVLIWGTPLNWGNWYLLTAISILIFWIGFACFQKTRKGFADVL